MSRPRNPGEMRSLTVRFPTVILEECQAWAEEEDRSLNEQLLHITKAVLAERQGKRCAVCQSIRE
jgi:hypothetical protein